MKASPEVKRQVLNLLKKERRATCGACGLDDVVDQHMRTDPLMHWVPRPHEDTDAYYCGCQDEVDMWSPWGCPW